jgi:CheY-like chemotaxis protein
VRLAVHRNEENDQILFSVSDTGIGIAREDLKKLFTPFTQVDSSLARQYPGTGLGLTLVQKLTDLHGGSVQVESVPGSGSRFTVALPLRQNLHNPILDEAVVAAYDHRDGASCSGGNILLAEDNETNMRFLEDYLVSHGYNVSTAQNGEEALEKAAQTPPHIILMDIQMPRMDGLEAMRHLRADSRFTSTPIIALSALAMPGDKERSLAAGATEYMSKPVSLKKLVQMIQTLVESKT